MVRVKLNDGTEVLFEMTWEEMREAFRNAVAKSQPLDVRGTNGKVWAVNPNLISYFEIVEPAELEVNGDRSEAADRSTAPA
jgi:hypothetical protein